MFDLPTLIAIAFVGGVALYLRRGSAAPAAVAQAATGSGYLPLFESIVRSELDGLIRSHVGRVVRKNIKDVAATIAAESPAPKSPDVAPPSA